MRSLTLLSLVLLLLVTVFEVAEAFTTKPKHELSSNIKLAAFKRVSQSMDKAVHTSKSQSLLRSSVSSSSDLSTTRTTTKDQVCSSSSFETATSATSSQQQVLPNDDGLWPRLEQKYYAIVGIGNRKRPYDPSVWDEKNPQILLWKVGMLTGRSGSAAVAFFDFDFARLCLMGYVYFRVLDTWADVCIGRKDRITGLALLPKRLQRIQNDRTAASVADERGTNKALVKWDLDARPRNRQYVDITLNVHRFDEVFLSLPNEHKNLLVEFATSMAEGWAELELLQDAPVTHALMRKHAEVALDVGFLGLIGAISPSLIAEIKDKSSSVHDAYIAYSDFIWYMNLAATIEDDVVEGVSLDEELRKMDGFQPEIVEKVRRQWVVTGLQYCLQSRDFLLHPDLVSSPTLRFFKLHFLQVSVDQCEKFLPQPPKADSGAKVLFRNLSKGVTKVGYRHAVEQALEKAAGLLPSFQEDKIPDKHDLVKLS